SGCRSVDELPVGRTFLAAEELVVGQTFLSATTTTTSGFRPLGREPFGRGRRNGWLRGGPPRGIMDLRSRARTRVAGLGTVLLSSSTGRRQRGASQDLGHPILDAIAAQTRLGHGPTAADRSERFGLHGGPGEQAAKLDGGHGPYEHLPIAGRSHGS